MTTSLFSVPPAQLAGVREISHAAVQWASRAARANLPVAADDSHSNLGWDDAHFALASPGTATGRPGADALAHARLYLTGL